MATSESSPPRPRRWSGALNLAVNVFGVWTSFTIVALVTERLFRTQYYDGRTFSFNWVVMLCQYSLNSLLIFFRMLFSHRIRSLVGFRAKLSGLFFTPTIPLWLLLVLGICFQSSGFLTGLARTDYGISFSLKILFRSCKPIGVLLFGSILTRTWPKSRKFILALVVTAGVVLFFLAGEVVAIDAPDRNNAMNMGVLLLILSLLADGLMNGIQEYLKQEDDGSTTIKRRIRERKSISYDHMNLYNGLVVVAVSLTAIFGFGADDGAIEILVHSAPARRDLLIVSVALVAGTCFIFRTLEHDGSFVLSLITTTRKMSSVCIFWWFGMEVLNGVQAGCFVIVLVAVLVDGRLSTLERGGEMAPERSQKEKEEENRKRKEE